VLDARERPPVTPEVTARKLVLLGDLVDFVVDMPQLELLRELKPAVDHQPIKSVEHRYDANPHAIRALPELDVADLHSRLGVELLYDRVTDDREISRREKHLCWLVYDLDAVDIARLFQVRVNRRAP
jgi:hypothetical protein